MATYVVYSDLNDGFIKSSDAVYATAQEGGTLTVNTTGVLALGQELVTGVYGMWESFLSFDTQFLGYDWSIDQVDFILTQSVGKAAGNDYDIEVRVRDWGTAVESTDWVPASGLGALDPIVAVFNTATALVGGDAYFTDINLRSVINRAGLTSFLLSGSKHRLGVAPGATSEKIFYSSGDSAGTSSDPTLQITDGSPWPGAVIADVGTGNNGAGATTVVVNTPASVVEGELMLCGITARVTSTTCLADGWALQQTHTEGSNGNGFLFSRVAAAGEPASYTFNLSASVKASGVMISIDSARPVEPIESVTLSTSTSTTAPAGGGIPCIALESASLFVWFCYHFAAATYVSGPTANFLFTSTAIASSTAPNATTTFVCYCPTMVYGQQIALPAMTLSAAATSANMTAVVRRALPAPAPTPPPSTTVRLPDTMLG